jgi:type II secretory pathway component PulF
MNRDEQLKQCGVCKNRKFDPKVGTICGLIDDLPTFSGICKDYIEESREVRLQRLAKEQEIATTKKTLNQGRYSLIVIGLFYVIMGVFEAFIIPNHELLYGIIDWGIASIFIGLGIWSFFQPYPALISGLVYYILLILLFAILDPMTIFGGIIWKILVIAFLVYSIKIAKNERSASQSNEILDQV